MDLRRIAPVVGAVACLVTVVVLVAPYLLVEGHDRLVIDYYAAGPVGAGGVGFLAALGGVIFLAGEKGNADPETIAGVTVVLAAAVVGFALLWYFSIDETVVYSFDAEYQWIEHHAPVVVACSLAVLASAGAYAKAVLAE